MWEWHQRQEDKRGAERDAWAGMAAVAAEDLLKRGSASSRDTQCGALNT